jgi:hypothetical protein
MRLQSTIRNTWRFSWRLAAVVVALVGVYLGTALAFYSFMQPSVVPNPGMAAYQPPAGTVVTSVATPIAPKPAGSEPPAYLAAAEPAPQPAETRVEPTKDTKKQAARTTQRKQQRAVQHGHGAPGQFAYRPQQGLFRPWF